MFDDYGRPINVYSESGSGREQQQQRPVNTPKVVKAAPKVEDQQDATSGVLKFRVKFLSEGIDQSDMDVLCQIGLDGIRILEPMTSRTLRIYSLENVTKLEVKEMGESNMSSDAIKGSESAGEKKKGFDWMKLMMPVNEEKDHWVPDEAIQKCTACGTNFSAFVRRYHCRNCGDIFCDKCTEGRIALTADKDAQPVRVCDRYMAEVTQRLSNAKAAVRVAAMPSHVDLAKELQEEMDKKRKTSTGHTSQGSRRMREVACPTCTVHLQA